MTSLQTLLVLSVTLLLCGGTRLSRQVSMSEKIRRMPTLSVCGLSDVPFVTRIVGGKPAELGEFPWMALLGYTNRDTRQISWQCGGSLITDQHVLTAAHCVYPSGPSDRFTLAKIRLGEHDLDPAVDDGATPQEVDVESVVAHEQYNNVDRANDIALVKMKRKVTFTSLIRPICLPPQQFDTNDYEGYFPIVSGWGKTESSEPRSETRLMKAEVEIQNTEICRTNITSVPALKSSVVDFRVICASSPGKDSCQGDSGGPLMRAMKLKISPNLNYFLMGIVSYGYGCAEPGYPGVYTRVAKFMKWIMENMDM